MTTDFIPQKGFYRKLRAYQVAEIIYDVTYILPNVFYRRVIVQSTRWFRLRGVASKT